MWRVWREWRVFGEGSGGGEVVKQQKEDWAAQGTQLYAAQVWTQRACQPESLSCIVTALSQLLVAPPSMHVFQASYR